MFQNQEKLLSIGINLRITLNMDRIDRKLLGHLVRDSSLTSDALGTLIGLSPSATHRRIKLLEASGAITGYGARLSAAAQGNPSTVFVSVTLTDQSQATLAAFEAAIGQCPEVREAHLMSGQSDYLIKVSVVESDSYERLHREVLSAMPGVRRLLTQFSIRAIRDHD